MVLSTLLCIGALAASVLLLLSASARVPAIVAVIASGLEVLIAFGLVRIGVAGLPLGLVLGAALLISAVVIYLRVAAKASVSAATVAGVVGLIQVVQGLRTL
jgi:hypothetical protein